MQISWSYKTGLIFSVPGEVNILVLNDQYTQWLNSMANKIFNIPNHLKLTLTGINPNMPVIKVERM